MIINDLDGYYIVFDTKNWNTELDTLLINISIKEKKKISILSKNKKKIKWILIKTYSSKESKNYIFTIKNLWNFNYVAKFLTIFDAVLYIFRDIFRKKYQ